MTVSDLDHAEAVKAAWEAAGLDVGDGRREHDAPCIVLYDLLSPLDGPLGNPDGDVQWSFQGTCVGISPAEARHVADTARAALANVTVTGRRVLRVIPDGGGALARDDDTAEEPLFYVTPRWRLFTTPA